MRLFALITFAMAGHPFAAGVEARSAADRDVSLDPAFRLVREAVEKDEVPGAIALVARGGTILRHEAFGLRDIDNQLPFTTNTLCWIASITKPVTVAAAMTLVDANKLGLDDPVEHHLPEFRGQKDTNGLHHAFTIRQLMSHTSGLVPNPPTRRSAWPIGGPLDDWWLQQELPDIVQTIARSQLRFKPGSKFEYSNSALFVLGRVIEVVSGRPYAAYVKEKILDPLGMTDTHYAPPTVEAERVARIYARRDGNRETIFRFNPAIKIVNAAPDGGLFSYPAQLVPFLQMFLDNDGRVLSRRAVAEMLKEQPHGWGLGWSLEDGLFLHEGSSGTVAWADPKTGVIGILFLQCRDQNKSDERLGKAFRQAVRDAFAEPMRPEAYFPLPESQGGWRKLDKSEDLRRWKDQPIIPKWFVDETAAPTHDVKTPELRWKLNPQIFSHGWELPARHSGEGGRSGEGIPADARSKPGSGGQLIAFVPSLDLVVVRETGSSGEWQYEEYLRRACAAVVQTESSE
jgi:CubicO group peptidase (beta-lactamase class C family)